jgi:uncharacterized membrane protein YbhN (UPF0104 family)
MATFQASRPASGQLEHTVRRRLTIAGLLAAFAVSVLLAVPALDPVVDEIRHISAGWLALAMTLELLSCVSFVVVFRLFFERVPASDGRLLAWTSMASGVLLPGGGVGGLAISGWLMRLTGVPTAVIIRRSSALFFFTTAVNAAAVIGSAVLLLAHVGAPHDLLRAGLPVLLAAPATIAVAAAPRLVREGGRISRSRWLTGIVDGIGDAETSLRQASWRLLGAIGYLFFDIAVLWATFSAVGHPPPVAALILAYTIGYVANALPIPGGIGVLDAGLTGALLLYGASPVHAAAAVLVYHAVAFWVPSVGGLIAYGRLGVRMSSAPSGSAQPCAGRERGRRSRRRPRLRRLRRRECDGTGRSGAAVRSTPNPRDVPASPVRSEAHEPDG